ncbi:palmitoleoyl-protein carboxylesterase NOTUM isoform X1 [Cherax quadricarinatus]
MLPPCWLSCRLAIVTMLTVRTSAWDTGGGTLGHSGPRGALGAPGHGHLDTVVGTRLMESGAVMRVAAVAERACCGLVDPTSTPLTRYWLTRPHHPHAHHRPQPPYAHNHPQDHATRAVCNDNSPAGFYFRPSKRSRRWIVFLEGGWYCFDHSSCQHRWVRLRSLMTSSGWAATRHVGGLLSPHPEENPHWWTANHVFVPYCSSDSWSGTRRAADGSGEFSFMGSVIVEEVVEALVHLNLTHGHKLILAGSSAGGVGVLVNVDRVARQLSQLGIQAEVRAVSDSGWFLDNEPFAPRKCVDAHSCPPLEAIRRGQELWQGRIPDRCREEYPLHPWYCYFGYRVYPTMQSPVFVFQWIFDEAQMTANNVGKPNSKEQWDYIHGIGERIRKTFENVTALFAPSCISHTVFTKRNWAGVKIRDVSLPQALYCWDITPSDALAAITPPPRRGKAAEGTTGGEGRAVAGVGVGAGVGASVGAGGRHQRRRHRTHRNQETVNQGHGGNGRRRNNQGQRRNGWQKSKKPQRKVQGQSRNPNNSSNIKNSSSSVQRNHLVLDSTQQRVNSSYNNSGNSSVNSEPSQDTNRPNILSREMLADSPKNSVQVDHTPDSPYLLHSNFIDTPQENGHIVHTEEDLHDRSDSQASERRTRRKRKRKKKNKRERERKKRKRERKRKRRERKRKQMERRKRREREKGQGRRKSASRRHSRSVSWKEREGLTEVGERYVDGVRSGRSLSLLHSQQSDLHHTEPVTTAASPSQHSPTNRNTHSLATQGWPRDTSRPEDEWTEDMCPSHPLHLTDRCTWPHCNYACPKLFNPFTGEEMNFVELLKSFGLDMTSVAKTLGIDIHTLNSMDNSEILRILTQ